MDPRARAIFRIIAIVAGGLVLLLTPLFIQTPSGTTIDPGGLVIDVIAAVVIVVSLWSWLRERSA